MLAQVSARYLQKGVYATGALPGEFLSYFGIHNTPWARYRPGGPSPGRADRRAAFQSAPATTGWGASAGWGAAGFRPVRKVIARSAVVVKIT